MQTYYLWKNRNAGNLRDFLNSTELKCDRFIDLGLEIYSSDTCFSFISVKSHDVSRCSHIFTYNSNNLFSVEEAC